MPEEGEKWGVGCLRNELGCQTQRRERSWNLPARFPYVTLMYGRETCRSRSAPSKAHREKCAGRPGASVRSAVPGPGSPRHAQARSCWGKNGRTAVLTLEASPGCSADNPVQWCGWASHRWQYWVLAEIATCGVCSWPLPVDLCSSDSISPRLLLAGCLK